MPPPPPVSRPPVSPSVSSAPTRPRSLTAETERILALTGDVYFRGLPDGTLEDVSDSVQDLIGYPPDALIGRNIASLYANPDLRGAFLNTLRHNNGVIRDHPIQIRHANSRLIWISTSCRLLYDSAGTETGIEGVVREITTRRETELQTRRQANLISALLDASRDAIMLIARDGTLLAANRIFAARFGATPDAIRGRNLFSMFPADVAAQRRRVVDQVIQTGTALHTRDIRQSLILDNNIYPVPGPDGTVEMVAVFSSDVTEQVRAEEQNHEYIQEIERSNEDLAQFAYVASHDLREPLRTLISYSTLLEQRHTAGLDEEGREFLGYIRTAARRMNALIEDLLAFSRAGQDDSPDQPLDTTQLVQAVIDDLAMLTAETGGRIVIETPLPGVVAAPTPIERLFLNLFSNALKYHRPDTPPDVRVGFDPDSGQFYVRDHGIGIAPEHQARIFQLFQRLDLGESSSGTGIGLAVCKKIVERLNGTLRVASSPGEGATFRFTLPLTRPRAVTPPPPTAETPW